MQERRRKELTGIRITALDDRGRGRGAYHGPDGRERPIAVTGALPGDLVDVQVRRKKAGTILAEPLRIVKTDHPRRTPFCRHFGDCGGCTVQDLEYRDQLALKEGIVRAAFTPPELASAIRDGGIQPILEAPREQFYRNKLEYSFGAQRWLTEEEVRQGGEIADRRGLGFHAPGRFDRVLNISECYLQPEPSGSVRAFLRELSMRENLDFYDAREHRGLLRLLIVRTALTGESMVTIMFGENRTERIELVMTALTEQFSGVTSLNYVVNTSRNDSIFPHEVVSYRGPAFITERCGPNLLRIRPKAFYQTNPEQAVRLYHAALAPEDVHDAIGGDAPDGEIVVGGDAPLSDRLSSEESASGRTLAFDLYCGIGSITLLLARAFSRVVGIETVEEAVQAARENADLNGLENAEFHQGEVETLLPSLVARYGEPDLVVVDPPRAGLHPGARAALRQLAPARIVYVSCNPRTQATDIRDLVDRYRITRMQPVDMFPQTRHVENVVHLERR